MTRGRRVRRSSARDSRGAAAAEEEVDGRHGQRQAGMWQWRGIFSFGPCGKRWGK